MLNCFQNFKVSAVSVLFMAFNFPVGAAIYVTTKVASKTGSIGILYNDD